MAALARALAFALIASGGALVQERLAAAAGVKWCSPRLDRAHYANFTEQLRLFVTQPRDALSAPDAVADAVRRVGLTPTALEIKLDENGTRGSIYGEESVWRLPVPGYAMSEGIWQIPQQLECAFSFLRTLHIQHWLTVGTWSGWTDAFTNAYMRRFAPSPEAFTHVTFDIEGHLTPCVSTQLNALRVTRVLLGDPVVINSAKKVKSKRREKDGTVRLLRACTPATPNRTGCSLGEYLRATTADGAPALGALPVYDLCFIDGDHTYRAVRRDFVTLLARCRAVMFHDGARRADARAPSAPHGASHAPLPLTRVCARVCALCVCACVRV